MEGLIPMLCKAIRRTKTRRQYECLSSGAAAQTYNIADFYVNGDRESHEYMSTTTTSIDHKNIGHRRHKSVEEFSSYGFSAAPENRTQGASPPFPKKIGRFRGHRMFSCVTGGA